MKDVMVDDLNARFLVMTALLGVGAAYMYKTGGSNGLIRILESKLTTKRRVLFLPYILGILVFFNDYANSDRKSTRLNSSHVAISYAVFCLKKKMNNYTT